MNTLHCLPTHKNAVASAQLLRRPRAFGFVPVPMKLWLRAAFAKTDHANAMTTSCAKEARGVFDQQEWKFPTAEALQDYRAMLLLAREARSFLVESAAAAVECRKKIEKMPLNDYKLELLIGLADLSDAIKDAVKDFASWVKHLRRNLQEVESAVRSCGQELSPKSASIWHRKELADISKTHMPHRQKIKALRSKLQEGLASREKSIFDELLQTERGRGRLPSMGAVPSLRE